MMHISLFSGIGGFELAALWSGWKNIASCEINEFGRKVLEYYWPDAYHHDDIHTFTYERLDDELTRRYGADWRSDDIILTGGFPCQPYSAAGKRQGKEDDRHLWPQMCRVIREVRPKWVVGENVLGLVNWNGGLVFDEVQADLEAEGYEVQPYVLPAASVGAPHRRDRVWFVAYNKSTRITHKTDVRRREMEKSKPQDGYEFRDMPNPNGSSGSTPDTDGLRGRQKHDEQQTKLHQQHGKTRSSPDTDTDIKGLEGATSERVQESQGGRNRIQNAVTTRLGNRANWSNFPTQSPVRGRNDGVPGGLDGITVSKWRNESIKAYGNAIVPQVAYQIFKAIQQYED